MCTGHVLRHPVNIEKCVVVPDQGTFDLQVPNDAVIEPEVEDLPSVRHAPHVLHQSIPSANIPRRIF